jgi:regulator of protease activity HflC (stomatin/prohibitin superfamily)
MLLFASVKVLPEYQRGVVLTVGRYTGTKGPGLVLLIPVVQRMIRVDLRITVMDVPPQDVISRDNVSVRVNAVVYFRVVQPDKSVLQVVNFLQATSQLAQTRLRSVLGQHELDEILSQRESINRTLQTRRPIRGASRSPTSRSRMSTSMKLWCALSHGRPRPSVNAAPR